MSELNCVGCDRPSMLGLKALQHEVLEGIARDLELPVLMSRLCERVEELAPEVICTVLSIDPAGCFRPVAAPSLPADYIAGVNGIKVEPTNGSCGAAASRREAVEVTDIANDPLWKDFVGIVLPLGLRACWSSPIIASDGRVIGTFAFYYRSCRGPGEMERLIVETCVHLCAIAMEQDERKSSIQRLAYFDPLTGVANRASFEKQGRAALAAGVSEGSGIAVHWLDLDNFKSVNDTLGHQAGDALLRAVSERLGETLTSTELLARIGGDEFVVLQTGVTSDEAVETLARSLVAAVSQPLELNGKTLAVGASVGIARAPQDGVDLAELMKKADLALYEAKTSRRKSYSFFSSEIEARIATNWRVEQDLRQAIVNEEFELHFQPIVDLHDVSVAGFEALIRWRRPGFGLVGPFAFLEIAEKAGLISQIGDWVLREACRLGARLPHPLRIAVNLSPTQLIRPGFALEVAKTLGEAGFCPERLELEITESALLLENAVTYACLSNLRQLGVSIALDDFGTGYSALSHLRAFPVDRIKIDRSFVQEVDVNRETASIVRAIIGLARELGVKTTAEGIETESQLRAIHSFGCDEIQGYLVSRPKAAEAFEAFGAGMKSTALENLRSA